MALLTIATFLSLITFIKCENFQNFSSVCGSDVNLATNSSSTRNNSVKTVSKCAMECAFLEESKCYGFNVFQKDLRLHCEYLYDDDSFPTCNDTTKVIQGRIYIRNATETCISIWCKSNEKCIDTLQGPKCKNINGCNEGWSPFGKKCFILIATAAHWTDAQTHCKNCGGTLAHAPDEGVNEFLKGMARNSSYSVWIGGFKSEEAWRWNGNNKIVTFTDWGYPNPSGNGKCLSLWNARDWTWDDARCSFRMAFICELPSLF